VFACIPIAWLCCALSAGAWAEEPEPLLADPARQAAEHERLAGEMEQLARRQVWAGLEDKFRELEALGVSLRYDELIHGAHAARAMGDVQTTFERLEAASEIRRDDELADWMRAIETEYGQVVLTTSPLRSALLEAGSLPFAPDRRAAVEFAVGALDDSGSFEGRLPAGEYELVGTTFTVEPGISLRIEVSTRRQRGRKADD